ncbi:hypothetical protein D8674_005944 [Pyrus ussuriensis x Pyrus communis]|uniref:Uncharacterized protein n=1 Tax=Pyrus ussuriensis x Pyrus communis TaxID=2448454 RepID=A0A5N5FTJ6_9ROSA|nr:hypothetical protein D8674_005944 [Pyrus ussuriensis x Pyrus communis]
MWIHTVPCKCWLCNLFLALLLCLYQSCRSKLPLYNLLHLQCMYPGTEPEYLVRCAETLS